jgi:crotonobetainyl-CoA:carnitine CoA-transferase CaiB-like acyl-CoA transferase
LNNAHAYLAAPYGIYATADGYLALAMMPVPRLAPLLKCDELAAFNTPDVWFTERDAIKALIAERLLTRTTAAWLEILEPADIWCADVLTWSRLRRHEGFQALQMTQRVARSNGASLETTRCPIRIDGQLLTAARGAPTIGEDSEAIRAELAESAIEREPEEVAR